MRFTPMRDADDEHDERRAGWTGPSEGAGPRDGWLGRPRPGLANLPALVRPPGGRLRIAHGRRSNRPQPGASFDGRRALASDVVASEHRTSLHAARSSASKADLPPRRTPGRTSVTAFANSIDSRHLIPQCSLAPPGATDAPKQIHRTRPRDRRGTKRPHVAGRGDRCTEPLAGPPTRRHHAVRACVRRCTAVEHILHTRMRRSIRLLFRIDGHTSTELSGDRTVPWPSGVIFPRKRPRGACRRRRFLRHSREQAHQIRPHVAVRVS